MSSLVAEGENPAAHVQRGDMRIVYWVVDHRFGAIPAWRIERDDLIGYGLEALVRAAQSWRADGGMSWTQWAFRKVDLELRSALRTTDHLSRRLRAGRGDDDLPEALRWPVSLDELLVDVDDGLDPGIETFPERHALDHALAQLPPRHARMVHLYYREDLALSEIAALYGISASRAAWIRTSALQRLRRALGELGHVSGCVGKMPSASLEQAQPVGVAGPAAPALRSGTTDASDAGASVPSFQGVIPS